MRAGEIVLALLLVGPPAFALARMARRARGPQGRPRARGPAGGWLAHRRALRLEREKHEHASIRDEARHKQRLAEQEAARQARAGSGRGPGGSPGGDGERPPRRTVRSRVVRIGDEPVPPAPAGTPFPPPGSSPPPAPSAPSAPSPEPPSPQPSQGSTVTTPRPAASGWVEPVIDGIGRIASYAAAGNIIAKRRAMLALIAICQRASSMAMTLSRALAEPGQHYGPEVTEPIATGALHLNAASLSFAQADSALAALLAASLAETMESGRQVPHHDQLTETGAR